MAATELSNGTLIAPFNAPQFEVETASYDLVRSAEVNLRMTPAR